ncbi:hypothetical protein [Micromonospora rubida]|uniref:hypothetical protein n=1 Tax=Micromonospora rubida TaxID=2697657 RepID=UPI001378F314|nr:hypothetical protein [Micromonospora rubida]NBE84887.1 hypothetical protein [Micromonospora rubida]
MLILQASLLIFAAISAAYSQGEINAAVNDAATRSSAPMDSGSVALKASYFHFQVRLTLWYALLFAPALAGVALWVRTGQQSARVATLTTSLLSVLCCCGAGGWLWLSDEPTGIDEALPAAFGRIYPAWVEMGQLGLAASSVPAFIAAALVFNARAAAWTSPESNQ